MTKMPVPDSEELRRFRNKLGLSQAELAKMASVSQSQIARIENKTVDPRLSTYSRIWGALERVGTKAKLAKHIMNKMVVKISQSDPISKAVELMKRHNVSQMPVVSKGKITGALTRERLAHEALKHRSKSAFLAIPVREIMDEPFPVINASTDLNTISALFGRSDAVLVTDKGKIVGIITEADVIREMIER